MVYACLNYRQFLVVFQIVLVLLFLQENVVLCAVSSVIVSVYVPCMCSQLRQLTIKFLQFVELEAKLTSLVNHINKTATRGIVIFNRNISRYIQLQLVDMNSHIQCSYSYMCVCKCTYVSHSAMSFHSTCTSTGFIACTKIACPQNNGLGRRGIASS